MAAEEAAFCLCDLLMLWLCDIIADDVAEGLGVVDWVMVRLTGIKAAKLD